MLSITAKAWQNAEKRGSRLSLKSDTRNLFRYSLKLNYTSSHTLFVIFFVLITLRFFLRQRFHGREQQYIAD